MPAAGGGLTWTGPKVRVTLCSFLQEVDCPAVFHLEKQADSFGSPSARLLGGNLCRVVRREATSPRDRGAGSSWGPGPCTWGWRWPGLPPAPLWEWTSRLPLPTGAFQSLLRPVRTVPTEDGAATCKCLSGKGRTCPKSAKATAHFQVLNETVPVVTPSRDCGSSGATPS